MLCFRFSKEINGMEYRILDLDGVSVITDWTPIPDHAIGKQAEYFAQRMCGCYRRVR